MTSLLLLLLPLVLATGAAETDYHAGIAAYRAGDLLAARARFERVVEGLPRTAEFHVSALYNLGRIDARGDRPCQARDWLDRFLAAARSSGFIAADQLRKARTHRADAHASCRPPPPKPKRWSAGASLAEGLVLDGALRRAALEAELSVARALGNWRLEAALGVGVEPPAPVLVRPGVAWMYGDYRARAAAQVLVRPVVGFGVLVGAGRAFAAGDWTLEPAVDGGLWPADGVYTIGVRIGVRRAW